MRLSEIKPKTWEKDVKNRVREIIDLVARRELVMQEIHQIIFPKENYESDLLPKGIRFRSGVDFSLAELKG